jgi:hypothetical protein
MADTGVDTHIADKTTDFNFAFKDNKEHKNKGLFFLFTPLSLGGGGER